jgi:hypothetical protein
MQLVEIALAPVSGGEAEPSNEGEQDDKYDKRSPVHFVHSVSPALLAMRSREIDDRSEHGPNNHPKKLVPVEEWEPDPGGFCLVVEWRPQYGHELDPEEQVPPTPICAILARLVHSPPH